MSAKQLWIIRFLLVALLLAVSATAAAQEAPPHAVDSSWLPPFVDNATPLAPPAQAPGTPPAQAMQTPDGLWMMPAGERLSNTDQPVAARQVDGGPDDFGYTFGATALAWIDASGGTNTGISAATYSAGPINIGFPFKYYENTYSQLWVSRHGFLAFNLLSLYNSQSAVPSPELPDDVIAPHWIPSYESPNYVRYLRGGSAPNRWFVMEWNRQRSDCCSPDPAPDEFTFQAVLYENGNIVFQYRDMHINGGYYCQASGIEDSTGLDGLAITPFCNPVTSNQAVRITRPAAAARVRIFPRHYGAFIYAGEQSLTAIPIRNTGELGSDTFDLTLSSSWAAGLFSADGVTPLTDTNGNGLVDTGPVAQGQTKTVTIKVWSALSAPVGNHNTSTLTARSWLDPSKQKTATSRIAVPAPFAQVYRDDAGGAMSMMLVKPQAQAVRPATPDWHWGYEVSVAELPSKNLLYIWRKGRCVGNGCTLVVYEIEYTILSPYGEIVRPVSKLTDHSGATLYTEDTPSGVAVAPDGRVGVVWSRYLRNSSTAQFNYNVYWAALDADGNLATGPINVTNNSVWGYDVFMGDPRIAATGDYRFVLAWGGEHRESAGWVSDIWYAVLNHTGGAVRSPSKLTNGSPGSSSHYSPALAPLAQDRTFISWITHRSGNDDVFFAVLDSNGNLAHPVTDLSVDETLVDWSNYDAVQLANGNILAVWEAWGCFPDEWTARIRYVMLDSAYNRIGTPACLGRNDAAGAGDTAVSVAQGGDYLAVLTWMDRESSQRRNLYYALVDANGVVVTPPTIFQTSRASPPSISSSFTGYGNTTYSWTPPTGVDSMLTVAPSTVGSTPGGATVPLGVKLAGRGGLPATSVRLTMTLDPRVRYLSDTSGVAPVVNGQTVTWNLPNLRLFGIQRFQIALETTGGALGDRLPVALQLTSAEPDLTPGNNQQTVHVVVSRSTYLPILQR